ncbi:enoyl-CoA hydratase/3-hydroxypropionyl-coenzyme A dehydratase [Mesobacillus persicus]|uniref:Enoyl-CoA hydratase/3-hydroxypropionyl-coenzyme A dehydratase n=1 Tax=Mesobacillus persicus TaxID=930146 RepID=A0A1H8DA77_9BACI|nr:enoyl-CoA hydratase/isomerase family protein [Mesobacillus persicus]SEN04149.1 enoyl-CoA hydratase/3-hydroxypropionyl-coenzyme A dehydratase [Mesobacillus persicus]
MKYRFLEVWAEESIVHVMLNQPANQNTLNAEMAKDLSCLARDLQELDDIKAIVLGGRGADFSIGLNPVFQQELEDETYHAAKIAADAIEEWGKLPFPIVAAIHGRCESLGMSLACVADLRIASEDVSFRVPESSWGVVPAGGITQRLPRLIGKGPALSMLLGGERMQASEAFQRGFVTKVARLEEVWATACELGKNLARMSSISTQYTKECVVKGSEMPFEQALRLELDLYMLLQTNGDRMEGVQAFLEKRTPQFKSQ